MGRPWLLAAVLLLVACRGSEPITATAAVEDAKQNTIAGVKAPGMPVGKADSKFYVSSTLFGACSSGLEALRSYWKLKGVDLTAGELSVRHGMVGCQTDENGMVQVTFYPPHLQFGGDITYIVDPQTMQVVRTMYGR